MAQPGYQEGSEPMWWWKVAQRLDEAQLALANAMAHNLDDQTPVFALQDKLREGQAILLEIFRAKGLLPAVTNGRGEMPGMPMPEMTLPVVPVPVAIDGETVAVVQIPPLAAQDLAVSEVDQAMPPAEAEAVDASPLPEVVVTPPVDVPPSEAEAVAAVSPPSAAGPADPDSLAFREGTDPPNASDEAPLTSP